MKRHWYRIYHYYCPVCGRHDEIRERMYGRKPKDWQKRVSYHDRWDGCEL